MMRKTSRKILYLKITVLSRQRKIDLKDQGFWVNHS
jgi:hypothetical protein